MLGTCRRQNCREADHHCPKLPTPVFAVPHRCRSTAEWPSSPLATWQDALESKGPVEKVVFSPDAVCLVDAAVKSKMEGLSQPAQDQLPTPTDGKHSSFLVSRTPHFYPTRAVAGRCRWQCVHHKSNSSLHCFTNMSTQRPCFKPDFATCAVVRPRRTACAACLLKPIRCLSKFKPTGSKCAVIRGRISECASAFSSSTSRHVLSFQTGSNARTAPKLKPTSTTCAVVLKLDEVLSQLPIST